MGNLRIEKVTCEITIAKAKVIIQQHKDGVAHFRKARCGRYRMFSVDYRVRLVFMGGKYYLMPHKMYDKLQKKSRL